MKQNFNKKVWIQAAIDVEDIDLAKKIAFMALDAGAEWLEVGTPLLYTYGHTVIGSLRKAVGSNAILVADYKCPFAVLCAPQAARQGADYVMLTAGYTDSWVKGSLDCAKAVGITPILDVEIRPEDISWRIAQYRAMGAEHIFSHHYSRYADPQGSAQPIDNMPALRSVEGITLGITSDDLEEAQSAVRLGADWITFGWVLRDPKPEVCRHWINTIRAARESV